MRIHALYHASFEGLGIIEDWVKQKGHLLGETYLYKGEPVPPVQDFDMLIIMGGPMSVLEEEKYPWMVAEKELIREARNQQKAILGVCLGAQMIANALGSEVYANKHKEIGWFPVKFTGKSIDDRLAVILPKELTVFHWHGDTFVLPKDAALLASSEATPNQGFVIGNTIIGLQFHLEMRMKNIENICMACADELVPARFVQNQLSLLQPGTFNKAAFALMNSLLDYLEQSIHLNK